MGTTFDYPSLFKSPQTIEESVSIMDSEELVDKAYDGLLNALELCPTKEKPLSVYDLNLDNSGSDMSIFNSLLAGIYIPGSKRCYWTGHVDIKVDTPPAMGCVYIEPPDYSLYSFVVVEELESLPKTIFIGISKPKYKYKVLVCHMLKEPLHKRYGKVFMYKTYISIDADGDVWYSKDTKNPHFHLFEQWEYGPGALSLLSDRQYIWNIETYEKTEFTGLDARVVFGIEEPMVKSLFYARSLPMTESGRRRPILHWVNAHKRRLQAGTDIDIEKYLRGISAFEMGNLNFTITRPFKKTVRRDGT